MVSNPFETDDVVPSATTLINDTLRRETQGLLLERCTQSQREFFARVCPGHTLYTDRDKLISAYELVRRTVIKNEAGRR